MDVDRMIVPLGIATYISLILTIVSAVMVINFHVSWVNMKWHTRFAILTLVLASAHAVVAIFF